MRCEATNSTRSTASPTPNSEATRSATGPARVGAQRRAGQRLIGSRAPHCQQGLEGVALVPALDEAPDETCTYPIQAVVEQAGQLVQRVLRNVGGGRVEQAFLVAEEVVDHRDVDAGIGGDSAHGGLLVP